MSQDKVKDLIDQFYYCYYSCENKKNELRKMLNVGGSKTTIYSLNGTNHGRQSPDQWKRTMKEEIKKNKKKCEDIAKGLLDIALNI